METTPPIRNFDSQKFLEESPIYILPKLKQIDNICSLSVFIAVSPRFYLHHPHARAVYHTHLCCSVWCRSVSDPAGGECAATRPQALKKHHQSTAFYQRNTIKSIVFYIFCHRFLHKKAAYRVRDSRQSVLACGVVGVCVA